MTNLRIAQERIEAARRQATAELDLSNLRLTALPPEVCEFTHLTELEIGDNELTELPPEVRNLTRLYYLQLSRNLLTKLPPEIGRLRSLKSLVLIYSQLTSLPKELGNLHHLFDLQVDLDFEWISPPPAVIAQGTEAILAFLRGVEAAGTPQWRSKLIVVGQGKSGKTSLVKALADVPHDPEEPTTHGLRIEELTIRHMRLGTWDFGGQEIYHATHQFFLTGQSLFPLVWSSRIGFADSRLCYWFDLIGARAPQAPVIVVATHSADRPPDLPSAQLQAEYPQIKHCVSVDNAKRQGIEELHAHRRARGKTSTHGPARANHLARGPGCQPRRRPYAHATSTLPGPVAANRFRRCPGSGHAARRAA